MFSDGRRARWISLGLLSIAFGVLFRQVFVELIHDWRTDENYSHGFLILPLAAYFAYERRHKLASLPFQPRTWLGVGTIGIGVLMLAAGLLGSEFFITRVALLITMAGAILFLLGPGHLRVLSFPLAFLLLMIPIPAIIFNQIAFPLQLLASRLGESALSVAGIPVFREGNIIVLSNTKLEVAEACSGIRSLVALLSFGVVFGYFFDSRNWVRVLVTLATIPLAIALNGLRIAGTGIAAHKIGPEAAEGFLHTFSGWLVFLCALLLLAGFAKGLQTLWPVSAKQAPQFS